jgi:tripartite-type tricarboxylate transporter receptor subunit TctC
MLHPRATPAWVLAAAAALPGAALAQDAARFPTRPVRVVVPQSPGGATDIQARLFAAKMSQHFGQQFIVDNRSGGGAAGIVAFSMVAKAAPDGHTLLAIVPSFTFSPALYRNYPMPMKFGYGVSWSGIPASGSSKAVGGRTQRATTGGGE